MPKKKASCVENPGWMLPSGATTVADRFGLDFIAVPERADTEANFLLLKPHYAAGRQNVPVELVEMAGGAILRDNCRDAVWTLVYDEYVFTAFLFHEIGHIRSERYFMRTWFKSTEAIDDLAEIGYNAGFTSEALSKEYMHEVTENIAWYFGYQAALVYDTLYSCDYASAVYESVDILTDYAYASLRTLVKHLASKEKYLRKNLLSMNNIGLHHGWKRGTGADKIENSYFWRSIVGVRFPRS